MSAFVDFDLQIQRPVSRAARLTSSTTDASQLPVHATAMELTANQSKTMSKSETIQAFIKDIFCLVREATAPCDILLKVRRI